MRYDMAKVIVERERIGHQERYRSRRRSEHRMRLYEDEEGVVDVLEKPSRSMKPKPKGYNGLKSLSENLNPLYKFLDKQVGRKWDKVFSEICANINLNSTVQRHIRQHVFDHVLLDAHIEGDRLFIGSREIIGRRKGLLYVDKNGILRRWKPRKIEKPKGSASAFKISEDKWVAKLGGHWFEVTVEPGKIFSREIVERDGRRWTYEWSKKDIIYGDFVSGIHWNGQGKIAIAKRQLSKKELKKYNLKGA